jgi:transcriptional regulator with PAS, ATPase and Fis domain
MSQKERPLTGRGDLDFHPWIKELQGAVTACDRDGIIISMNADAVRMFSDRGGEKLLGSPILDCHPEPARSKLKALMESRRKNIYTIQKNGLRKLIFQAPWYLDGEYAGYVELDLEIPWEMPHFNRDQQ